MSELVAQDIIRDLAQTFLEHGQAATLLRDGVVERNALDEMVRVDRVEVLQTILQRTASLSIDGSMMELPAGTMDFVAPWDTQITEGALIKLDKRLYQVTELTQRRVYGVVVCLEGKAERADADGSG